MSKVTTSIPGRPGSSITSAFKTAQIAAMGQELQPSLGPWDLAYPRETPEGESTDPMPRSLGPNHSVSSNKDHLPPWVFHLTDGAACAMAPRGSCSLSHQAGIHRMCDGFPVDNGLPSWATQSGLR